MAGLPPRTDITRHSTIEATSATLGSTPETNENEITSGISASAVMMPASDSRTKRFGARSTAEIDGASSNSDWVAVGVATCMGSIRKMLTACSSRAALVSCPAVYARRSGSRCDRWRNRPFRPDGPTAGTEGSSWARRDASRPSPRGASIGHRPRSDGSRIAAADPAPRHTGSTSIPRRCRPCRTGRSRWPETRRPARSPRIRPR